MSTPTHNREGLGREPFWHLTDEQMLLHISDASGTKAPTG
jgi:hypothetical protein